MTSPASHVPLRTGKRIDDHHDVHLNERAFQRCEGLVAHAGDLRVAVSRDESGTRLLDCGVHVRGVWRRAVLWRRSAWPTWHVSIRAGNPLVWRGLAVAVTSDQPVGCLHGVAVRGLADHG